MLKDHSPVTPVMLKPTAPRSRVKHSTTEPLRCPISKGYCDVCNKELWIADSLLKPTVIQYNENTKYGQSYGRKNWFFMTQLLYLVLTFYRLLTAIMCFEACVRFKRKFLQVDSVFGSSEQHAFAINVASPVILTAVR